VILGHNITANIDVLSEISSWSDWEDEGLRTRLVRVFIG
jgi:hypothetical protein